VKSDDELADDVVDELFYDPRVPDLTGITVAVDDGAVTLSGTVATFREKLAAAAAARRVVGVSGVDNRLWVELADGSVRADVDVRAAALQALSLDGELPPGRIDAHASDGVVTLTGTVFWRFQRDAAEADIAALKGITGIENRITIHNESPLFDVAARISEAFERNATLRGTRIDVASDEDCVTLSGSVDSWAQHDAALETVWAAPGITRVRDLLRVGVPSR
jgi:osmotically-inducible protein OsmY